MKIIRSVKDTQGNIIQKQPAGGTGQQRCSCGGICTAQRAPGGQSVMRCGKCGKGYTSVMLDSPKPQQPGVVPRRAAKPMPRH